VTTYRAIVLDTGAPYDYQADAPVAWSGMNPPEQHTLIAIPPTETPIVVGPRHLTKKQFADRFTADEFSAIMDAVASVKEVRDWWTKFLLLAPASDSTSIDLDSPDAHVAVVTVFYALEQMGVVAHTSVDARVMEVLA
jgi:hypothetical protein